MVVLPVLDEGQSDILQTSERLGLLGSEEVQTSVKFVKLRSPHPHPLSQRDHNRENPVAEGLNASESQLALRKALQ